MRLISLEQNKAIIRCYYRDLWNKWDLEVADEIIDPNISFRGSLNVATSGLEGFKKYVRLVRSAFPDFYNSIDDLIAEGDKVVARLSYRGIHRGELFGIAPTGKQVTYTGIAIFRIKGGKIVNGWVSGDTLGLLQQLGAAPKFA